MQVNWDLLGLGSFFSFSRCLSSSHRSNVGSGTQRTAQQVLVLPATGQGRQGPSFILGRIELCHKPRAKCAPYPLFRFSCILVEEGKANKPLYGFQM